MANKLELEEYLYRRALDIIESTDSDVDKDSLLFQEVWLPLADLYKDKIKSIGRKKKKLKKKEKKEKKEKKGTKEKKKNKKKTK